MGDISCQFKLSIWTGICTSSAGCQFSICSPLLRVNRIRSALVPICTNETTQPHTGTVLTNTSSLRPVRLSGGYSVGGSRGGEAGLPECAAMVGERWFWRGALRGRSPCTREGRRPDRPDAKKGYRYETEILLRAAGGGQIQVERGKKGVRSERHGRRHRQE